MLLLPLYYPITFTLNLSPLCSLTYILLLLSYLLTLYLTAPAKGMGSVCVCVSLSLSLSSFFILSLYSFSLIVFLGPPHTYVIHYRRINKGIEVVLYQIEKGLTSIG